jgi:hypothetical protein
MATDSKKKKFKAVPQKVKLFRANDPVSVGISVFMWGVNHSVSYAPSADIDEKLLLQMTMEKKMILMAGCFVFVLH